MNWDCVNCMVWVNPTNAHDAECVPDVKVHVHGASPIVRAPEVKFWWGADKGADGRGGEQSGDAGHEVI